jgi:16S rRNA (guanine966-N2)-methyltransferase
MLADVNGASVLDLFAGTGALTIEALSRGAENAVLVERDRGAAKIIRANLSAFELTEPVARLICGDAIAA